MVEDRKIAVTLVSEISCLKPEEQALLVETIECEQVAPQAQRMKKLSQSGELNEGATALFSALDVLFAADLLQMKLYCEIGHLVIDRPEKGAAVATAEYRQSTCPDVTGFSLRNLCRIRTGQKAPLEITREDTAIDRSSGPFRGCWPL